MLTIDSLSSLCVAFMTINDIFKLRLFDLSDFSSREILVQIKSEF